MGMDLVFVHYYDVLRACTCILCIASSCRHPPPPPPNTICLENLKLLHSLYLLITEKVHTPTPLKAVGGSSKAVSKTSGRQTTSKSQAVGLHAINMDAPSSRHIHLEKRRPHFRGILACRETLPNNKL